MSQDYESVSDTELIVRAKENDCAAFGELSGRYFWLIRSKARMFEGSSAPEKEDLFPEGLWGLYVAAITFDQEKEAGFPTYAGVCIYNRMVTAVRRHGSNKNRALNESLPLDSAAGFLSKEEEQPEAQLELQENFQQMLEELRKPLSPLERRAFDCYLSGLHRSEITEKTGLSLKVFDNALHRVRRKLKMHQEKKPGQQ